LAGFPRAFSGFSLFFFVVCRHFLTLFQARFLTPESRYQLARQLLHLNVFDIFPAANTPHISAEPTLLALDIFSISVDLQVGHLMVVSIGRPQCIQLSAESEICFAQSGQFTSAIILPF
jgi:hypothetical protein